MFHGRFWHTKIVGLVAVLLLAVPLITAAANTPTLQNIGDGVNTAGKEIGFSPADGQTVYGVVGRAILWINSLAGIVVLLFLIYGGWLWMTADGKDEKITQAKQILKTSFIALIIIFGAAAISLSLVSAAKNNYFNMAAGKDAE